MENKLIIIRGPAGVGKTSTGKKLAKKLDAAYISFDRILKENGLNYIPEEPCVPEEKCIKGNEIILFQIIKAHKEGKSVVIEGNFYHKSQINHLIKNLPRQPVVFTLKAAMQILIDRDKTRKGIGEEAIKDVNKLVSKFDYGKIINTNHKEIREVVNEIISELK